jgi:hypothetical protein
MKGIIDTSSLLNITRYYIPFDKNGNFKNELERLFLGGEIVVIDKVIDESKNISRGIVPLGLPFIFSASNRKLIVNTSSVLPDPTFLSRLETDYCNQTVRTRQLINAAEFANRKTAFVRGADAKQIIYALKIATSAPLVVTEESSIENDGKLFKKIPSICLLAGVSSCTVPDFLKNHCKLDLGKLLS